MKTEVYVGPGHVVRRGTSSTVMQLVLCRTPRRPHPEPGVAEGLLMGHCLPPKTTPSRVRLCKFNAALCLILHRAFQADDLTWSARLCDALQAGTKCARFEVEGSEHLTSPATDRSPKNVSLYRKPAISRTLRLLARTSARMVDVRALNFTSLLYYH